MSVSVGKSFGMIRFSAHSGNRSLVIELVQLLVTVIWIAAVLAFWLVVGVFWLLIKGWKTWRARRRRSKVAKAFCRPPTTPRAA